MADNKHIFLMIIPYGFTKHFFRPLRGLSSFLLRYFKDLPLRLEKTSLDYEPEDYITAGLVSYSVLAFVFGLLMVYLGLNNERPLNLAILLGFASGFGILLLFLFLLYYMPGIQSKTRAESVDQYLLYALKDFSMQVGSGNTIFEAMKIVATSNYGEVSAEFSRVTRRIQVGIPMRQALEEMIRRNDSVFLKKTGWQIINSLRAGGDIQSNLQSIIKDLDSEQKSKIIGYSRELNLWSLVYMLFAVAIPTIGSTTMVILSTFAGFGLGKSSFIMFIVICTVIQVFLVNFVKARRPVVQF